MALVPQLQWLCEDKLVRATHGVITNAREDHLDVMGPTGRDVAKALAGMIPPGGKLYTADRDHLDFFAAACADRRLRVLPHDAGRRGGDHAAGPGGLLVRRARGERGAVAARVRGAWASSGPTALQGMWQAKPDPGAMTAHEMNFFGREINFVNGFAANDPQSTELIWRLALERYADVEKRIAIFNCRDDRPDRSRQLGEVVRHVAAGGPLPADRLGHVHFRKIRGEGRARPAEDGDCRGPPARGDFRDHRRAHGPPVAGDGHGEHRRHRAGRGPVFCQSQHESDFQVGVEQRTVRQLHRPPRSLGNLLTAYSLTHP